MSKIIILIAGFFFFTACSEAQTKDGTINKVISAKEFQAKLSDSTVQLVDVRTAPERAGGKIDGSVNYDFNGSEFNTQLEKLDKSKPVLVYCASGRRSASTAEKLKSLGFKEVYDLEGGYNAWPFK